MQYSLCQNDKRLIYFGLFRDFGVRTDLYDPSNDAERWRHAHTGGILCSGVIGQTLEDYTATPGQIYESSLEELKEQVAKTGGRAVHFETFRSKKNGQFYFRLVAVNGESVAQSEGYHNEADRDSTISLIRQNADQASIIDKGEDEPTVVT